MVYPTTYNGYNVSWTRGKLSGFRKGLPVKGIENYYFSYNAFGQRTNRSYTYSLPTVEPFQVALGMLMGYSQEFCYDQAGRLICERKTKEYYQTPSDSDKIVYLYDADSIIGMVYTENRKTDTYYFQRNVFGDVVGIYDVNGTKVGGYAYDAWGNCTITQSTKSVVTRNPIRYRGYYYDQDTKLYYLNTRYYSPEWRRFISPDDTAYLDSETPNGLNLYAYCGNNPVMNVDPSGYFWDTVFDIFSIVWSLYDFIKDPSLKNAGWLAMDVGFAVIPFLTGSSIIKGASKLDDIYYVGKGINRLDDIYDTVVLGNDMNRVMDRAWDIGATFYGGYGPLNALSSLHDFSSATDAMKYAGKLDNARFIIDKFNAGYKFVHVGSDGRGFFKMMKSAYGMELKILYRLKYGNKIHKAWWLFNFVRRIIW